MLFYLLGGQVLFRFFYTILSSSVLWPLLNLNAHNFHLKKEYKKKKKKEYKLFGDFFSFIAFSFGDLETQHRAV